MKALGYALITVGFLLGSLVASWTGENSVRWTYFVPSFLLAVAGVALARLAIQRAASAADKVADDLVAIRDSLERVVGLVADIDGRKESIDVYDLHGVIDRELPTQLDRFVNARESIVHAHGLQAYADVMNRFASGERYLNRAWSASVDGYIEDAHASLARSLSEFRGARDEVARVGAAGA